MSEDKDKKEVVDVENIPVEAIEELSNNEGGAPGKG